LTEAGKTLHLVLILLPDRADRFVPLKGGSILRHRAIGAPLRPLPVDQATSAPITHRSVVVGPRDEGWRSAPARPALARPAPARPAPARPALD
jgi:hypothetical protein